MTCAMVENNPGKIVSTVCLKPRLYDVRGLYPGPGGCESTITCLMIQIIDVHNHMVLLIVVACLRPLLHGATSPQMMKQHLTLPKPGRNSLLILL